MSTLSKSLLSSLVVFGLASSAGAADNKRITFLDFDGLTLTDDTTDIAFDKAKWTSSEPRQDWTLFTPDPSLAAKERRSVEAGDTYPVDGPVSIKLSNSPHEPPERIITPRSYWERSLGNQDVLRGGQVTVMDTTKPASITTCKTLNKTKGMSDPAQMVYEADSCRTLTVSLCFHLKEEVGLKPLDPFKNYTSDCKKILGKERPRFTQLLVGDVKTKHKQNLRYYKAQEKPPLEGEINDRYDPLADQRRCELTLRDCNHPGIPALSDWSAVRLGREVKGRRTTKGAQ
ncbi:MAG: hypothetical protein H6624_06035 [Bdellovibrionaceae bacterium]|nr:hypothetical protein [Bdellovibrionales bacterium]MCB9083882.1 hypothetical protein [Pseudobdellovibrionaceae bacterium]